MTNTDQYENGFAIRMRWLLSVYFLLLVVYGSISIAGWEDLSLALLTGREAWIGCYPLLAVLHLILCYQLVCHRYVRWVWYLMVCQAVIVMGWGAFDITWGVYDKASDETAFSRLTILWGAALIAFGMMSLWFNCRASTKRRFVPRV